jgi:hypothetical protein
MNAELAVLSSVKKANVYSTSSVFDTAAALRQLWQPAMGGAGLGWCSLEVAVLAWHGVAAQSQSTVTAKINALHLSQKVGTCVAWNNGSGLSDTSPNTPFFTDE